VSALLPYLRLARAPAALTAVSNILAAHLVATGGAVEWPALALLAAASACLYSAGMVLNDCFDLAEDRRERPGRPLPSGAVPVAAAWALGWALLALGVALAGALGTRPLAIAAAIALLVALYDGGLKCTAAGPLAMGGCRYLNWVLGLSVAELGGAAWLLAAPAFLYTVSITLLSREETRAEHRGAVAATGAGLVLTGAAVAGLVGAGRLGNGWALLPLAVALAAALYRLAGTYRELTPQTVQEAVRWLIIGVIPLDAIIALAGGPWWAALAVLALLLPTRWLARRTYVT
jgi:4-hydroxybenzoate polyprenyltransferase